MITGKWSARAICAVHSGRQSDDQQFCVGITKRRDRPRKIIWPIPLNLIKETRKPWTISAVRAECAALRFSNFAHAIVKLSNFE